MDELIQQLNQAVRFPGLTNAWTMPIKTRIDMLSTGIKTPVGIKIMGDDLTVINRIGEQVEAVMRNVPGTLSAIAERAVGGYFLDYQIDRSATARYGVSIADIQEIFQAAIGGMKITDTVEGLERYSVNVRYDRDFRSDPDSLGRLLVPGAGGSQIPLAQLGKFTVRNDPDTIKTENARRTAWVYVDIQGSDIGSYVAKARKEVAAKVTLPAGYNLVWSGEFENMEKARAACW